MGDGNVLRANSIYRFRLGLDDNPDGAARRGDKSSVEMGVGLSPSCNGRHCLPKIVLRQPLLLGTVCVFFEFDLLSFSLVMWG